MNNKDLLVSSYDYNLPKKLIAKIPATPADSARLLVYNRKTKQIIDAIFKDIINFIPKKSAIVFNNTKVIKARIYGKRMSGGKVELLVIKPLEEGFLVLIKGKVKVGTKLFFQKGLDAVVRSLNGDGSRVVEFFLDNKKIGFKELILILEQIGHIPLPPYMQREDTKEDEKYYQPIFAKKEGSVAAPTASLHFTKELLERLKANFDIYYLTLHIGAGTFRPVEVEDITKHKMHSEFFNIPKNVAKVIDSNKKILAVGTTTIRTIEDYIRNKRLKGQSEIFLHPLNPAKRVDYLLTNFHLPKSTLLMLVSSFIGRDEVLRIYHHAIEKNYRFYSYGDAMLII